METNYQKFLAGEYCNHLDQEVLQMIVQTKNLLARLKLYIEDDEKGDSRNQGDRRI